MSSKSIQKKLIIFSLAFLPMVAQSVTVLTDDSPTVLNSQRTIGSMLDDQALALKALQEFNKVPALAHESHISVISYDGVAILIGQVPNEDLKNDAECILSRFPETRQVYNELSVSKPVSMKVRSQDAFISTQLKAKIFAHKQLSGSHVIVATENGVVYLLGMVDFDKEKILIDLARRIKGVTKVVTYF